MLEYLRCLRFDDFDSLSAGDFARKNSRINRGPKIIFIRKGRKMLQMQSERMIETQYGLIAAMLRPFKYTVKHLRIFPFFLQWSLSHGYLSWYEEFSLDVTQ
ncbi:hypothetical protein AB6A40_005312 [Gnathostoma spinigerum]|uniref:Uncharacterized protein n=1 Tax=Gnathostoma spinigerum TaxID=75299 RepID=A0ABD6EF81_9BILA